MTAIHWKIYGNVPSTPMPTIRVDVNNCTIIIYHRQVLPPLSGPSELNSISLKKKRSPVKCFLDNAHGVRYYDASVGFASSSSSVY